MYERVNRINDEVRKYDRLLFARKTPKGVIQVCRKQDRLEASDFGQCETLEDFDHSPRMVIALTDDWTAFGKPVEWGLEPVMQRLRDMDAWSHDVYGDFDKSRQRRLEDKERQKKSDIRDRAKDLYPEFKKAVADIS